MVNRNVVQKIRKTHRYLGLFLGIQFLFWTISGLYFSWTNIDEIHGDHFKNEDYKPKSFDGLIGVSDLKPMVSISEIELKDIGGKPYYWINDKYLYDGHSGELKKNITEEEALAVVKTRMRMDIEIKDIQLITITGKHHEYRGKLLPAYVISYDHDDDIKVYVSVANGTFQTVRHRNWRWFDFLWMTHTMDYEGRDDFNNTVLRVFSLLGIITVCSGFLLWFVSSPSIRKLKQRKKKNK